VLHDGPIFDPRTWNLNDLQAIQSTVLWALLRSSIKRDECSDDVEKNKAMSEEFIRLMALEGMLVAPGS
jgi:hypothetical protein